MPTSQITFIDAPAGTPQRRIYDVVSQALRFMSLQDFVNLALGVLEQMPLPDGQFLRIKYAIEWKLSRSFGLDDILAFIFYGNWQDVGLTANATANALDESGREGLMQLLYGVAAGVVQGKIAEMTQLISWEYETPDWVIVEPEPDPEPDPELPPDNPPEPPA